MVIHIHPNRNHTENENNKWVTMIPTKTTSGHKVTQNISIYNVQVCKTVTHTRKMGLKIKVSSFRNHPHLYVQNTKHIKHVVQDKL